MNAELKIKLAELFNEAEKEFPDNSTEFILEVAANRAQERGIKNDCDCGDIAEAIE